MDDKAETADNNFIYTNWRGKSFVIDEKFAESFRNYMVEEGCSPGDIAYITPKYLMETLPDIEWEERTSQLEEMWEGPKVMTDR
jgi:hypothetical protein